MKSMFAISILALTTLLLQGCGVAETAAVATAQGASAAEQAEQAKAAQEKIMQGIDAAQQTAADARAQAESASE